MSFIQLLTFNDNNIIIDTSTIEWKKQTATNSKKKDLSAIDFLNTKYGLKLKDYLNTNPKYKIKNKCVKNASVFAYFDYCEDKTIYLMYITFDSGNKKNNIELIFDSHIPSLNMVEIVDGSYDIECLEDKIIIKGYVFGICLSNETYYCNQINTNQYIEYVQRNSILEDSDDDDNDKKNDEEDEDEDKDKDDDEYNEDNKDDDDDDEDDDDDDDEEDEDDDENEDEDDDEDYDDDDDDDDYNVKDVSSKDNIKKNNNEDEDEDEEDEEEDEIIEEETIDDDTLNEDSIYANFEIEVEKKVKVKKNKPLKCHLSTNIDDFSIISKILKSENKDSPLFNKEMHIIRQNNIKIFDKILDKLKLPKNTSKLIERGIYNYSIDNCNLKEIIPIWENPIFVDIYISKSKHIYSNINNKSYVNNVKLIDKLENGTILPYDLAFIDSYKLFPERWADIIDEKFKTDKMLNESLQECATDLFECPRCFKNKTIYLQIQLRSSDEPMTNFITCVNCGNKWQNE